MLELPLADISGVSDVLWQHYHRCPERGNSPVPPRRKPGRERRACNQCAQSKLKCDLEMPCETCLSRGLSCTYSRLESDRRPDQTIIPESAGAHYNVNHSSLSTDPSISSNNLQQAYTEPITESLAGYSWPTNWSSFQTDVNESQNEMSRASPQFQFQAPGDLNLEQMDTGGGSSSQALEGPLWATRSFPEGFEDTRPDGRDQREP